MDYQSISMNFQDNLRHLNMTHERLSSQLASGERIVTGAIDPSGLNISMSMEGRLGGMFQAIHNAEDALSLVQTADSALNVVTDMLFRIRDLGIRMANSATANTKSSGDPNAIGGSDQRTMYNEMVSLTEEIRRELGGMPQPPFGFPSSESAMKFNTKNLFYFEFANGQDIQIGSDSASSDRLSVVIPSLSDLANNINLLFNPFDGTATSSDFATFALNDLLNDADGIDADIQRVNDVRAQLGIQASNLQKIISDLNTHTINLSGTKSNIADVDMAEAISELHKNLVTQTTLSDSMIYFQDMQRLRLQFLEVLPANQGNGGGVGAA